MAMVFTGCPYYDQLLITPSAPYVFDCAVLSEPASCAAAIREVRGAAVPPLTRGPFPFYSAPPSNGFLCRRRVWGRHVLPLLFRLHLSACVFDPPAYGRLPAVPPCGGSQTSRGHPGLYLSERTGRSRMACILQSGARGVRPRPFCPPGTLSISSVHSLFHPLDLSPGLDGGGLRSLGMGTGGRAAFPGLRLAHPSPHPRFPRLPAHTSLRTGASPGSK